jgi:mannitol/fructose-specific phosphotransferase system IIA component
MINMSTDHMRVGGRAPDEAKAIRLAVGLLIKQGNTEPGYADSMLARVAARRGHDPLD